MEKGVFITFEGGEGSGKSTQSRLLAERLRKVGLDVLLTREPGGTEGAEIIREMLLSGALQPFGSEVETMALYAARADHLDARIKPALKDGKWVICDRFSDSTRAYQGAADKVDKDFIAALDAAVVGQAQPDITFLLDLPAEDGLARARLRGKEAGLPDRFEKADLSFHEKLREGFRAIAKSEPGRVVVIDAARKPDEVAEDIWQIMKKRLAKRMHGETQDSL